MSIENHEQLVNALREIESKGIRLDWISGPHGDWSEYAQGNFDANDSPGTIALKFCGKERAGEVQRLIYSGYALREGAAKTCEQAGCNGFAISASDYWDKALEMSRNCQYYARKILREIEAGFWQSAQEYAKEGLKSEREYCYRLETVWGKVISFTEEALLVGIKPSAKGTEEQTAPTP